MAPVPTGRLRDYFIWGATAAMLRNLYAFLLAAEPQAVRPDLNAAAIMDRR